MFSLGYGCMRFAVEFFREPDQHIGFEALGWMTRGQLLCLPMMALGIFLLVYAYSGPGQRATSRSTLKKSGRK